MGDLRSDSANEVHHIARQRLFGSGRRFVIAAPFGSTGLFEGNASLANGSTIAIRSADRDVQRFKHVWPNDVSR
ncbi:MAG TPA: hypothetical protein DHB48_04980 [Sphingobium sp.]|nr:hypothetical protein [Sphingobium sp.]HCW60333.1 hypothetical protein [Sphingobium sp.]